MHTHSYRTIGSAKEMRSGRVRSASFVVIGYSSQVCVCVCVFDDTPVGHGCWMFVLLLVGAKWAYSSFFAGQKHTHKRHGRSLYYFIQSLFFSFAIDSMMTTARVHQLQPPGARPHLRRREDKSYCASHNKKYLVVPCC